MSVTIDNHTFDRVHYDAHRDVLYLHKGEPSTAVDFDSTPEGHALPFNAAGELVGITGQPASLDPARGPSADPPPPPARH